MEKRRKWLIIAGIAVGVLLVAGIAAFAFLMGKASNLQDTAVSDESTEQVVEVTETDTQNQTNADTAADNIKVQLVAGDSWGSEGNYNTKYDLIINNNGTDELISWKVKIPVVEAAAIQSAWNCNTELITEGTQKYIVFTPVDYNKNIASGMELRDIGFIIMLPTQEKLSAYIIEAQGKEIGTLVADNTGNGNTAANEQSTEAATQPVTAAPDPGNSGGNGSAGAGLGSNGSTGGSLSSGNNGSLGNGGSPASAVNGGLRVSGTKLVDSTGAEVQLKGLSTHGISWFPSYVNEAAFKTFRDDWGANVIRIAMYPDEYNGYLNGGNQSELEKIIDNGVSYATKLNMYVIIDWHILAVNPNNHKSEAITFFDKMSKKYADNDRVIYEICNEPKDSEWNSQIKPYAEEVIAAIRKNDSDALVLVGTNTWSQDVDAVVGNKLSDSNVMYVMHFYAATHKQQYRNKLIKAINGGVPVFVSECSICEASGNGNIDYDSANEWLKLLNDNKISFIAWNISNKDEKSAIINKNCSKLSGWSVDDLSETGKWFRTAISGN